MTPTVVVDTTKVRIFKQITTRNNKRNIFFCCCWYHKGTNFQANHNGSRGGTGSGFVVVDTTKVRIFKQITTKRVLQFPQLGCCWYHKGTNFQANHNQMRKRMYYIMLLLIPQRYEFSSKSQPANGTSANVLCCCWYHKGTNFQANHNSCIQSIFNKGLLLISQRYEFSSKSQPPIAIAPKSVSCCWYHKGTNFQANHNSMEKQLKGSTVVVDTTKVRIFKQITTLSYWYVCYLSLLLIPQRYEFSSKSQRFS